MIREIKIGEAYQTVRVFDSMRSGDIVKVPYEKGRYDVMRTEASQRNKYARLEGKLKNKMDIMFRVSIVQYPGYITIMRVK
jgi:hypothetical protein